jgi:hypothetical protein
MEPAIEPSSRRGARVMLFLAAYALMPEHRFHPRRTMRMNFSGNPGLKVFDRGWSCNLCMNTME